MGAIVPEVAQGHLMRHPQEELLLRPFLHSFDVTWARQLWAFGSELSVYFLKPAPHMERAFGFESEILTVYSQYPTLQPRTLQAVEVFLSEQPARGRVDTMTAFLISEEPEPVSWIRQYMISNPESRLVAGFSAAMLRASPSDSWLVRSTLSDQLHQRDLFDHRLPVNSDYFFFGREDLIFDLHNAFRRSENRGLFGLRKTGKTSVFFKLKRIVESNDGDVFVYIDCKLPSHRMSSWDSLLARVASQLTSISGKPDAQSDAAELFLSALSTIDKKTKVGIVFDEIEYISPVSPLDSHWQQDFIPFWQTIWHAQSLFGNLAVFVGGVNPTVVEQDLVAGTQNPLFGIVPHHYLGGLTVDEIRRMLRTLGRPMGLRFEEDAVQYIFRQYGGHPLLTRIACSGVYKMRHASGQSLPLQVDRDWLTATEAMREAELGFYCSHVVSELRLFYPDEYDLMVEIAAGHLADMFELAVDPTFTAHLNNYGLLARDDVGRPAIAIPVLQRFVNLQKARENGQQTIAMVQPVSSRGQWLLNRKSQINDGLEELQRLAADLRQTALFGPHSYPESHRFFAIGVVASETDFAVFINTCNRCFVESMENYGRSIGDGKYSAKIQNAYPALANAFRRIKLYRHSRVHIKLTDDRASDELGRFLKSDLAGRSPTAVPELWFQLQQCVLDDLLVGVLVEVDRLT